MLSRERPTLLPLARLNQNTAIHKNGRFVSLLSVALQLSSVRVDFSLLPTLSLCGSEKPYRFISIATMFTKEEQHSSRQKIESNLEV